jgi:hypothetical protein
MTQSSDGYALLYPCTVLYGMIGERHVVTKLVSFHHWHPQKGPISLRPSYG